MNKIKERVHKFIAKHHQITIISACIVKNVALAISLESALVSGIIGYMTVLMIKSHLFDNHHLLHIKKHYPHQEIPINPNKKGD